MRLFGVPIRFDFSALFLVYIGWIIGWQSTGDYFASASFVVVLFASLLTHEFMHVFAASRYGIKCKKIHVMALGAGAMLTNVGNRPGKTFVIAGAGPITSFFLAAVFIGVSVLYTGTGLVGSVISFGVSINLILGIFNVIPMYPLDGGRLAHAVAWKLSGDKDKGMRIAVLLSRILIVGLMSWTVYSALQGSLPLFSVFWYGMFAVLLWWMGASALRQGVQKRVWTQLCKIKLASFTNLDDAYKYFAHPINTYDTDTEKDLIDAMLRRMSRTKIENPNKKEHQEGYARWREKTGNGMDYFIEEVLPGCGSCAFLAFRDDMIPAGVAKEVQWFLDRGLPVREIAYRGDTVATCPIESLPENRILSVEETRARIRDEDGNTIPY